MTTFEEDLNRRMDLKEVPMYFTQSSCSMTRKTYIETNWVFDTYKNWHSDEEFQKMLELGGSYVIANKHLVDDNAKLVKEIADLKSKLEQQDILIVPEFVGEFVSGDENELSMADRIAYLLKSVEGDNYYLEEYLTNAGIISQEQGEHLYAWATNQTHETILKLWNGFTVEKLQKFYLRNKLTGLYLYKKPLGGYGEEPTDSIKHLTDDFKFTQKEIDGMDVQSYEKKDEYKGE